MAFGSEYKSGSGAFFGAPIAIASENPLDPRMVVENYSDLIKLNSWAIQGTDTGNKGFNTAYHGMITAVKAPADKAGLYQLVKSSDSSTAKADLQSYDNWQKISVSESEFTAILNRVTAIETSDTKKLDKDFVTQSSQGTLGEGTTFAARSDITADATNVYITGKQIKDFAATAVSDKGTFADDTALKAAYPTPEDGWSATVLSTGTTWISADGQWTDSGKSNGVTSVNGKSGKVTLVAADIDDVLSDTETDEHIESAITTKERTWSEDSSLVGNLSVTGAIEQVGSKVNTALTGLNTLSSTVDGKQDKTINLEIQGATAATVSDALTSLDTALTTVKSTADDAAKKDASNIEAATWKTVLGYQSADEVATAVNNGITTNEYATLTTTAKTVKGAIDELKTAVDGKVSSGDFTSVKSDVDALKTTVGDAESGLVKDVADNAAAINTANTNIAKKQNTAISIDGIEAKTVEGALTEIKNATSTNATAISAANTVIEGKADKATTLAGYGITDAYTKTEVNTELGKKQDKLKFYSELGSDEDSSSEVSIHAYNTNINSAHVNISGTETGITLTASGNAGIKLNGAVSGTAISTSIPASTSAVDTKLPSEKAVATAIESVKEVASKAYKYKGSDTYDNIIAKENPAVGDVWNSTTANGVYPKGTNYAWNGTEWDALGGEVDLSAYQKTSDDTLSTTSKTVVGAINEVKGVADAAAKADASNITVATWKEKLGFITASEVPEQVQPDWNAITGASSIANKPNISKSTTVSFETYELNNEGIYTLTSKTLNGLMSLGDITVVANSLSQPVKSITVPGGFYQAVLELTIDVGKTQRYIIDNIGSTNPTIIKEVVFGNDNTLYIADITSDESGKRVIAFANINSNKAGSNFLRFELKLAKIATMI